jgi:serine/threonine protein kinase
VYEGSWNGREVAIKTLRKRHDETALSDFEREANIMKELQHTNVIQLLGVVMSQNPPLVIMELMGACFLDLLKSCQLSEKDVLDCGMQVRRAHDGCS